MATRIVKSPTASGIVLIDFWGFSQWLGRFSVLKISRGARIDDEDEGNRRLVFDLKIRELNIFNFPNNFYRALNVGGLRMNQVNKVRVCVFAL